LGIRAAALTFPAVGGEGPVSAGRELSLHRGGHPARRAVSAIPPAVPIPARPAMRLVRRRRFRPVTGAIGLPISPSSGNAPCMTPPSTRGGCES